MMNSLETYSESGRKTAIARNQKDEARAAFESDWFKCALRLEDDLDKPAIRSAFDNAYKQARKV